MLNVAAFLFVLVMLINPFFLAPALCQESATADHRESVTNKDQAPPTVNYSRLVVALRKTALQLGILQNSEAPILNPEFWKDIPNLNLSETAFPMSLLKVQQLAQSTAELLEYYTNHPPTPEINHLLWKASSIILDQVHRTTSLIQFAQQNQEAIHRHHSAFIFEAAPLRDLKMKWLKITNRLAKEHARIIQGMNRDYFVSHEADIFGTIMRLLGPDLEESFPGQKELASLTGSADWFHTRQSDIALLVIEIDAISGSRNGKISKMREAHHKVALNLADYFLAKVNPQSASATSIIKAIEAKLHDNLANELGSLGLDMVDIVTQSYLRQGVSDEKREGQIRTIKDRILRRIEMKREPPSNNCEWDLSIIGARLYHPGLDDL